MIDELDPTLTPERMLALAQDPTATPRQIGVVAQIAAKRYGFSSEIVQAAAANPNGSLQLILYLLAVHPCIVMHNPALPLVLLEDPSCLERAHAYALHRILSRADAPVFLCHWLAAHSDPQVAAAAKLHIHARDPGTRPWVQEIRARLRPELRRVTLQGSELARLGLAPPSLLERWKRPLEAFARRRVEGSSRKNPAIATPLAAHPLTPGAPLRERIAAARQCACSETLDQLAGDRHSRVRAEVARNPHTDPATLERLAGDPSLGVQCGALANSRLRVTVSEHQVDRALPLSPVLALAILENPNTTEADLESLSRQPALLGFTQFRRRLARHANTPPAVLSELADDSDLEIRHHLAHHPQLPSAALPRLRAAALRSGPRAESAVYRTVTLMHPELSAELQLHASEAYDWLDRAAVALNPNLDEVSLRSLAEDGNRVVRAAARARLAGEPPPDLWASR